MADYLTATLKIEVSLTKNKTVRGRITGYTAEYHGISGDGPTKAAALATLSGKLALTVADLGNFAIVSDSLVGVHLATVPSYGGGWGYRHLDVADGRVTLGSCTSGGSETYTDARERMTAHMHNMLHGTCRLCYKDVVWSDLVYYSTLVNTRAGIQGDCPMHVCTTCETTRGLERTTAELCAAVPHNPRLWRIGPIAPNGDHPKACDNTQAVAEFIVAVNAQHASKVQSQ